MLIAIQCLNNLDKAAIRITRNFSAVEDFPQTLLPILVYHNSVKICDNHQIYQRANMSSIAGYICCSVAGMQI